MLEEGETAAPTEKLLKHIGNVQTEHRSVWFGIRTQERTVFMVLIISTIAFLTLINPFITLCGDCYCTWGDFICDCIYFLVVEQMKAEKGKKVSNEVIRALGPDWDIADTRFYEMRGGRMRS